MLKCQEVTEKASDYLDNALSRRQRHSICLHLFFCHHCRRYLRQLRAVTTAVRQMSLPVVSEESIENQIKTLRENFQRLNDPN